MLFPRKSTPALLFFLLSLYSLKAQSVKIKGQVFDSQTQVEMPFATISLTNINTKVFSGVATDIYGNFELTTSPGIYNLSIRFTGYITLNKDSLRVNSNDTVINLGKIMLKPDSQVLDGAVIVGEKEDVRLEVDKKVFNVENSVLAIGGTALDVLNQIPTIDVDMDGNVTLRGSSDVLIYINGKPTGFSGADRQAVLQQIPAANIERIEIITNPSAKYDAEGTSGIINIILKSATKNGWNANFSGGAGSNNKYNGSASFSFSKNKFRFTSTYGFRYNENWSRGTSNRINLFDDTTFYLNQNSNNDRTSINNTLNGTLDYLLSKNTTLSLNWLGGFDTRQSPEDVFYTFSDFEQTPTINYLRNGNETRTGVNGEIGFGVSHNFKEKGHSLVFLSNVSKSDNIEDALFRQDLDGSFRQLQNTESITKNILPVVQLDYTRPGKKDVVWETGLKFTMRLLDNNFLSDTLNFNSDVYDDHQGLTNNFVYNEIVNAAYINYAKNFKKFKFKGGVRVEQTLIEGEQKTNNTPIKNQYINFFPSVFFTKELKKKGHEAQISYSRRINRPRTGALNPFAEQTDPFNLRIGNPNLNPELIDAIEATYFISKNGNYLTGTAYYRQTNGIMQRVRSVDNEGVSTMTYLNLDVSRDVGLEGIVRRKFKNLNTTLNLNLFRNQVTGTGLNTSLSAINYSWFGKFLASYKLNSIWDLQASYFYRGKITYVQGTIEPMHGLDLGLKVDVLKKKGAFSLNVTDVFNTKQFEINNAGQNFESNMVRKWETRILTVNFTYKIGSINPDWDKKPKRSMDGGGGGDMDF